MIRTGLIHDTLSASRIISFFTGSSTHVDVAFGRRVFDQIPQPNAFTWNFMMRGYVQNHSPNDAISLYKQMLVRGFSPDNYTYPVVTKACSHLRALKLGEAIHGQIVKCGFDSDMFVMSGVVSLYTSCGEIGVARVIFDEMTERDVVSWTTVISGYVQLNCADEALLLFDEMKLTGIEPNKVTLMSLLSACSQLKDLSRGQWLHSHILENRIECDMFLGNSLMNMYAKCGSMSNAIRIFESMPVRNTSSWNVLIGGLVQYGLPTKALELFWKMGHSDVMPNEITVVSALSACSSLGDIDQGKLVHMWIKKHMINCDVFVLNALINMYAKCGDLNVAACIFHEMPDRDVFSWTAMITGYVQGNQSKEALCLFQEMQQSGVVPNEVTLVSLLSACAQLGALDQGKWIHTYIEENNVRQDLCVGNVLVDMYGKCGCIESALHAFHRMCQKDTFSWNAMIGGLAANGYGREALDLFAQMLRVGDARPDNVTFTAVLSACTHSGMVHGGLHYFKSMSCVYGITPRIEHYGCIVDLLGRAGLLQQASDFIEKMPIKPNAIIWGSLLAACQVHRKVDLGEKAAKHIFELAPYDEGAYVLISNMYAEAGRWGDVRNIRTLMGSMGIEKFPGFSSIEMNGTVHDFYAGDTMHHQYDQIYMLMDGLMLHLKQVISETS